MPTDQKNNSTRTGKAKKQGSPESKMEEDAATADNTKAEFASIKNLLKGIAADVNSLKTGMEKLQSTVESLGSRMTDAETRISDLEDANNSRETSMDYALSSLKALQDKVTYLEDYSRLNNVRVMGIPEKAEGGDMMGFVLGLLSEQLGLDVNIGFEIERVHRVGQAEEGRTRHVLIRFLRFSAREAVLAAAREKEEVKWDDKKLSFFQDLSHEVLQQRKKFDDVKKQLKGYGIRYFMKYPATLKFSVNNKRHSFTSPNAVATFLASRGFTQDDE